MAWSWARPWTALALFSFVLNLSWELLAMPYYTVPPRSPGGISFPIECLQATLGDVVITLVSFAAASLFASRRWLFHPTPGEFATYLGVGVGATVVLEYVNVEMLHRWAYVPGMPTIAGIGTLPLVQWVLLPPIVLWLARRHSQS